MNLLHIFLQTLQLLRLFRKFFFKPSLNELVAFDEGFVWTECKKLSRPSQNHERRNDRYVRCSCAHRDNLVCRRRVPSQPRMMPPHRQMVNRGICEPRSWIQRQKHPNPRIAETPSVSARLSGTEASGGHKAAAYTHNSNHVEIELKVMVRYKIICKVSSDAFVLLQPLIHLDRLGLGRDPTRRIAYSQRYIVHPCISRRSRISSS